jgi:protein SCO1
MKVSTPELPSTPLRATLRFLVLLVVVFLAVSALSCAPREPIADLYPIPDFTLTERSGRTVTRDDLKGHVWIASFVFTNCGGPCPRVSKNMQGLQKDLAAHPDIRLVTITVDPARDDPERLKQYADTFEADPQRWLFLTGPQEDIYDLLRNGFKLGVEQNVGSARKEGQEVVHSTRLVLVDKQGHIRGYFEGDPEDDRSADLKKLRIQVIRLQGPGEESIFPPINASLNALCVVLLLIGWLTIRQGLIGIHKVCMLSALLVSATFLGCYLYFHLVIRHGQPTYFVERAPDAPAWITTLYYTILGTHTILAIAVTPMALISAYLGLQNRLARHRAVARWTMPIWLYVSVTGVVVYWMLYRLYPLDS